MSTRKSNKKDPLSWSVVSDDICTKCGEEMCQERWISKSGKVIIVRDCDPQSVEKLPKYLLKAMKGFI